MRDPHQAVFLLQGRSIDGTVWATGHGWVEHPGGARAFRTRQGAEGERAEAIAINREREVDGIIGHLTIVTLSAAEYAEREHAYYRIMEEQEAAWDREEVL